MDKAKISNFNRARLDDRMMTELIGISRGILADDKVNQKEVEYLHNWLIASKGITDNPIVSNLSYKIEEVLQDKVVDEEEQHELFELLNSFVGGKVSKGELLKSTTLPFDEPQPDIVFKGSRFCFTGTFVFGSRKDCENAVKELGGEAGGIMQKTDYLVIGFYATDSWMQSSYGRKIEKALEFKKEGHLVSIVGEEHWRKFLNDGYAK